MKPKSRTPAVSVCQHTLEMSSSGCTGQREDVANQVRG